MIDFLSRYKKKCFSSLFPEGSLTNITTDSCTYSVVFFLLENYDCYFPSIFYVPIKKSSWNVLFSLQDIGTVDKLWIVIIYSIFLCFNF